MVREGGIEMDDAGPVGAVDVQRRRIRKDGVALVNIACRDGLRLERGIDRKSTRLNSSHTEIYTLSLHDALPISLLTISALPETAFHRVSGSTMCLWSAKAGSRWTMLARLVRSMFSAGASGRMA